MEEQQNEIGYEATANVDDYYEQEGIGGLDPNLFQEEEPKPPEEEQKAETTVPEKEPINDQINSETGEPFENNFLQEVGTAVMGAGIDLAEDVGEVAQRTVQGKWLDDEFQPTWLQVDDAVEPMQTTRWGQATRGLLNFGLGFVGTAGAGHLAKASKIPGLIQAGRLLAGARTTKLGQGIQGAARGAVVTFTQSASEEGTVNDMVSDVMPWFPRVFSVDEDMSPLEKRGWAVLEDVALGGVVDMLIGFRAGGKAAKRLDEGLPTKGIDEASDEAVKAQRSAQKSAIEEQIQLEIDLDPSLSKPRPSIHPDYFEAPDKGIRSVGKDRVYSNLKDLFRIANEGNMTAGRRATLVTEAALSRISKGLDTDATKLVKALKTEIDKGFDLKAGKRVGGTEFTMEQIRQLGVGRYVDIMETFPDLAKANWEEVKAELLKDSIVATGTGKQFMDPSAVIASEMLMTDMAAAVSDRASAMLTVADIPSKEAMNQLLDNFEAGMLFNQESSEFAGSLLRSRAYNKNSSQLLNLTTQDKKKQVRTMMKTLRKEIKKDPEMAPVILRAFAESDGEASTLAAIQRFMTDQLFKPGALVGKKKSYLIEAMFGTLYNSVLSAPKTLSRAFLGTNLLTVMRPIQIAMGGALAGDKRTMAKGMHMAFNGFDTIREAFTLSRNAKGALIDGTHISQTYKAADDESWKMMGIVIENGTDNGAKSMYRRINMLRNFNAKPWVNYPGRALSQIDIFSKTLIGRQELSARAFDAAYEASGGKVTAELMRDAEKRLRDTIFDSRGDIIDEIALQAGREVALQKPLTGKLKDLDNFINSTPIIKPFFLFNKTGANALEVVQKHTPLLARFNDEVRAVLSATPERLDEVLQYGITDANGLKQAQALVKGRVATGQMTVMAAIGLYATGNLSGNGPRDFKTRQSWIQNKWKPRSIKIGGEWVSYEGLEPFHTFLALAADIGDWSGQLGEAATENMFQKLSYLIAQNLTNKSFLAGLEPLQDIISTNPERMNVWAGNMANNFLPFSSLRNEIANVINPGMREVENDFWQAVQNRNPILRGNLPLKYDPLDGSVVKMWDLPTRMYNSISPISISGKDTETRRLLRESGYDLNATFTTDNKGNKLTPEQASRMQELMGKQNLEGTLEGILLDPVNKERIEFYRDLREEGVPGKSPDDPKNVRFEDSRVYELMTNAFNASKNKAMRTLHAEFPELKSAGRRRDALKRAQGRSDKETINKIIKITGIER